jgi:pimeloyl-ACP methyl ester carboxylesterase
LEFCAWAQRFMGVTLTDVDLAALSVGLRHPGLIIHDCDDRVVAVEQSRALQVTWTRSTLIETSGLGHRRILSDPEVIGRAVEFMAASRHAVERRG